MSTVYTLALVGEELGPGLTKTGETALPAAQAV